MFCNIVIFSRVEFGNMTHSIRSMSSQATQTTTACGLHITTSPKPWRKHSATKAWPRYGSPRTETDVWTSISQKQQEWDFKILNNQDKKMTTHGLKDFPHQKKTSNMYLFNIMLICWTHTFTVCTVGVQLVIISLHLSLKMSFFGRRWSAACNLCSTHCLITTVQHSVW